MDFDWDPAKAATNEDKHGVPFGRAVEVFVDGGRIDFDVSREADHEIRRKVVGYVGGRVITVVYTIREGRVRLISARPPNAQELRRHGDR